jgi:hypothetical protein
MNRDGGESRDDFHRGTCEVCLEVTPDRMHHAAGRLIDCSADVDADGGIAEGEALQRRSDAARRIEQALEILLAQDCDVMRDVSRCDVGKRAHGERLVVRDAATQPCIFGQGAKQRECSRAHALELGHQAAP